MDLQVKKSNIIIDYNSVRNLPFLTLKFFRDDKDVQSSLSEIFDFSFLNKSDDKMLFRAALNRRHFNILKVLKLKDEKLKDDIDFDKSLDGIYKDHLDDIINIGNNELSLHSIAKVIPNLIKMEFTDKIIVYSHTDNTSILADLVETFGESQKLLYCGGDIISILDNFSNTNLLILDNPNDIQLLVDSKLYYGKNLTISREFYNVNPDDYKQPRYDINFEKCEFGFYVPLNMDINKGIRE